MLARSCLPGGEGIHKGQHVEMTLWHLGRKKGGASSALPPLSGRKTKKKKGGGEKGREGSAHSPHLGEERGEKKKEEEEEINFLRPGKASNPDSTRGKGKGKEGPSPRPSPHTSMKHPLTEKERGGRRGKAASALHSDI